MNRKTDTGKTLKRWPVLVDHYTVGKPNPRARGSLKENGSFKRDTYTTKNKINADPKDTGLIMVIKIL